MAHIFLKITGIPYSQNKTRGDTKAPARWTEQIIKQTQHLPKIDEACIVKITFLLPSSKYPKDLPYGPDLDNLLKRFMDALNQTVSSQSKGMDSCAIEINVMKTRVGSDKEAGALLEILPLKL